MGQKMNVLLTGGTGFLGEYLLAELLERGHSVYAMYRSEPRKLDTIRFLSGLGLPHSSESLRWFKGEALEAHEQWENWVKLYNGLENVDTLLHSAASTRLHMDEFGEPLKTNLGSAKTLARLVEKVPMKVHMVSTAYVCGFTPGHTVYEENHPRGDFVNVYEESKWEAEQIWQGKATILRPGIIVGHSETGRCTSFSGYYILWQAMQLLDRLIEDAKDMDRSDLRINVPANPDGNANIVPVDYVAKAAVRIIEDENNHNKIFHLTHHNPPTHQQTLDFICDRFNIGGVTFGGEGAPFTQPRNTVERMVFRQLQAILFHFSNNPQFDISNVKAALPNLKPPEVDEKFLQTLLDFALKTDWGQNTQ